MYILDVYFIMEIQHINFHNNPFFLCVYGCNKFFFYFKLIEVGLLLTDKLPLLYKHPPDARH